MEQKTDYAFFYNNADVDTDRMVSVKAIDKPIDEILSEILPDCSFRFENKKIIIVKKQVPELSSSGKRQIKKISGTVKDEAGEAIIGANVLIKGTLTGTMTDINGRYSFDAPQNSVLIFSSIGYLDQEITVQSQDTYDVTLLEDKQNLEEVVVIGYGSARKKDLTGAISSIKADKFQAQAPRNIQDILRSNAAGLNIGITSNAKDDASLSIRGKGTLSANSDPLIVLDGVIFNGSLADITPDDVESIDILKDASSAAVYGAKAANGVIAITTKKGHSGKPIVTFSTNLSMVKVANQPKILSAKKFLKFRQDYNEGRNSDEYLAKYPEIFVNPFELKNVSQLDWYNYDQKTPVTSVTDEQLISQWLSRLNFTIPEMDNYFANKITHWDDLVFQNGFQQSYTAGVSNATDRTSQYFSVNWVDREGVVTGDRFTNFRVRANMESRITSFLAIGMNTQFAYRNEGFLACDWGQMTMISPYGSNNIDDPESIYQRRPTGLDPINPFYDNLYRDRKDIKQTLNSKLYAKVTLPFGIEYEFDFTPYLFWSEYYNHNSSKGENWRAEKGDSQRTHAKRFNWQIDNIVHWKKDFGDHNFDLTFLFNAEKLRYWSTTAKNKGYSPNDNLGYHALQSGTVPEVSSNDTYATGDALMARLFYSYKGRYMLTASFRRDGYSAFGKENPHANFPAVALGWVFSQEKFLSEASSWLDFGKLRFSWGANGNRDIGQYAALSQMNSAIMPYIDAKGNVVTTSQMYVRTMANYGLKWERTTSNNIGLDFSIFQGKLSGTIEAYLSKTNDLLVSRRLPNITGFSSVYANLGELQNKGLEITLNSKIISKKDFNWSASWNFSLNRRKINELYGDKVDVTDDNGNVIGKKEADDETNGWFIGQDPDRIWGYERDGVWQLDERQEAAVYGCQPGDFKYKDMNNDGVMNNKDKVFQGYTTPRFRWNLRSEWTYKNFSLSMVIYSFWKFYGKFNRAANNYSFPDRTSDYDFPRWTRNNPINDYARIGSKNIGDNWVDKSFIRLQDISLSYTVPSALTKKIAIQNLRVFLNINNVGVWSPHWDFWDPENGSIYPRTFSFGVNVTL